MENSVRLCTHDDVQEAQDLVSVFYFFHRESLKEYIDASLVYCIPNETKLVSIIIYSKKKDKILFLGTSKKYQRNGLAKKLLQKSINLLGIQSLRIKASLSPLDSTQFWLSQGFIKTEEIITTKRGNKLQVMTWKRDGNLQH